MEWKRCMNVACGASSTSMRWRRGWVLRSGDFAVLCDKCGYAYEQSTFCDVFHSNDSGWRQCNFCGKHLHCGCIVSRYLFELQDTGGVSCITCAGNSRPEPVVVQNLCIEKVDGSGTSKIENISELQCTSLVNQLKVKGKQVGDNAENDVLRCWLKSHNVGTNVSSVGMKQDATLPYFQELGSSLISHNFHGGSSSSGSSKANMEAVADRYKSLAQTNLRMTLSAPFGNSNPVQFRSAVVDEREKSKTLSQILPGAKFRPILPMFPISNFAAGLEAHASMASRTSVAMPPPRRGGRNQQLRPRYWPRITDQELQQISGDSNSTIVPLFEKMLSASDAGPIGRIVLPKACAETYLPPISQPEGLPLQIHDVHGNIWDMQFRFWPNDNSRMYVLEGVSPCIQTMQLKAGDTVTFSRMDPEGKLIMGVRKAPPSASVAQSPNGSSETSPHDSTMIEGRKREGSCLSPAQFPEKKRTRNIGSKSKRLLIDSQDALELTLTWEEAQDLFHPPPSVNPSLVMIEDHVLEEYEEPPIFGKRSTFIVRSNRINEQWTQCDSCSKWRKLPVDILLPAKWTCMDNIWDQSRCSCSAPNELTPREVDNLVKMMNKEFKKQRKEASHEPTLEHASSGLDALADAALLEDNASDSSRTPIATTAKHSQRGPGCSCIVCVQQRDKHKPTCNRDACTTSLMMQRMSHQSKHEAETAHRNQPSQILTPVHSMNEGKMQVSVVEAAKGQLDLNCQPDWEGIQAESKSVSMMNILQEANLPPETSLKESSLNSMTPKQQANSASNVQAQTAKESKERNNEDCCTASTVQE